MASKPPKARGRELTKLDRHPPDLKRTLLKKKCTKFEQASIVSWEQHVMYSLGSSGYAQYATSRTPTMFTTLKVQFRDRLPYRLERHRDTTQQGGSFVTRVNSVLHESETTSVFRATSTDFPDNELVLKIIYDSRDSASAKALRHEFDMYNTKLKALQGDVVPCCHGLFEGQTASGFVSCLVLDYVGETSFLLLEELSMEYRYNSRYCRVANVLTEPQAGDSRKPHGYSRRWPRTR